MPCLCSARERVIGCHGAEMWNWATFRSHLKIAFNISFCLREGFFIFFSCCGILAGDITTPCGHFLAFFLMAAGLL